MPSEKFEKDSNSLTFQQFDSRNLIISNVSKVAEEGGKRNDYRLSFLCLFPFPPTFREPFTFASSRYLRAWNKLLVTYRTLPSLYVCVWLVNTLNSTAPIGSPIICTRAPADICERWERNLTTRFSRR